MFENYICALSYSEKLKEMRPPKTKPANSSVHVSVASENQKGTKEGLDNNRARSPVEISCGIGPQEAQAEPGFPESEGP